MRRHGGAHLRDVGGSGAGFQPAAAGHLARVPNTGWKTELAGRMPCPTTAYRHLANPHATARRAHDRILRLKSFPVFSANKEL